MNKKELFIQELKGLQRIVINDCYGGFGLSDEALQRYKELAGLDADDQIFCNIKRNDPYLVQVVNEMGHRANDTHSNLKIVTVPSDVEWHITDHGGNEWVAENHRTWS